ncbi:MAG: 30S ribosomal protein S21 [Oscillospiraceae bacterium]|nr:30S ribosomal protein S21 [Oscillospiraceae bacterium]
MAISLVTEENGNDLSHQENDSITKKQSNDRNSKFSGEPDVFRHFKRKWAGIVSEIKEHSAHKKPSVKRKTKDAKAFRRRKKHEQRNRRRNEY